MRSSIWYQADASSGTTLIDSSGHNQTANLTGSYSFASGVSGNALSLTGGNAVLPTGIVSSLNEFTISAWVKVTTLQNWARIFDFGTGTTDYMFLTADAGGTNALRFAITTSGNGAEQQVNGPALVANTWTHVAVTLAGNTATMYVNGLVVASNANVTIHPTNLGVTANNYLGKSQFPDPALQGRIDDFRLFGRALSATEVLHLADPAVVTAAASTSPVTTTTLSILGSDVTGGESGLTYTWATTGSPPAPVNFSANGTNAAKNVTATFTKLGTYNFLVTLRNGGGLATTSSVSVTVKQVATSITVSPGGQNVPAGTTQQYSATVFDQFGNAIGSPSLTWSVTGAGNSISTSGLFTAGTTTGPYTVTAQLGSLNGNASVNVVAPQFNVTNLNDSGPGSLRQAILDANAGAASPDLIIFLISGSIQLAAPLPNVTNAATFNIPAGSNVGIGTSSNNTLADFASITLVGGGILTLGGSQSPASAASLIVNSGSLALVGSVSALSGGFNGVNIINNSISGLQVSGANQIVGGIDGTGSVVVNAGSDLTANHLNQNALVIGGSFASVATMTIAPSDASGNPLAVTAALGAGGSSFAAPTERSSAAPSAGLNRAAVLALRLANDAVTGASPIRQTVTAVGSFQTAAAPSVTAASTRSLFEDGPGLFRFGWAPSDQMVAEQKETVLLSAGESSADDDSATHLGATGQMMIDADAADTLFAKIGARRAGP